MVAIDIQQANDTHIRRGAFEPDEVAVCDIFIGKFQSIIGKRTCAWKREEYAIETCLTEVLYDICADTT